MDFRVEGVGLLGLKLLLMYFCYITHIFGVNSRAATGGGFS